MGESEQDKRRHKRRQLLEDLTEAERVANESHKDAMNSYGAGYDRGIAIGLRRAIDKVWEQV